ncbi:hypothetical protein ACOME3_010423 [Neoechinorhynchus agilis]
MRFVSLVVLHAHGPPGEGKSVLVDRRIMRQLISIAIILITHNLTPSHCHHLRASNLNSPGNHGDVLLKAAVDSKDVVYIPAQVGDGKTAVAAMGLAVSREFPFSHEMLVAATCWPALNRPHIAYNRNFDVDQDDRWRMSL